MYRGQIKYVIKRDGSSELFDVNKIRAALEKAFAEVDGQISPEDETIISEIADVIDDCTPDHTTVEEIQNEVELELMDTWRKDVAKAYITYRYLHGMARDQYRELMDAVSEKLSASNVVNQNANVDEHSFGGRMGEASSLVSKEFALTRCMSKMARDNHSNNEIYVHDLDSYSVGEHNCTDGNSWIAVRKDGEARTVRVGDFAEEIGLSDGQLADVSRAGYQILARDGWTKLVNVSQRHLTPEEKMYTIRTRTGLPLKLTAHHRLPVIRDGKEVLLEVQDIQVGDELLSSENIVLSSDEVEESFIDWSKINCDGVDIRVTNLPPLKSYLHFKYGVTFASYASDHNWDYGAGTINSLRLDDFFMLMNDYPLSYEVLSQLEISALGSKHKYPYLIPYSAQLAKLYAYIYSDGSVYENEERSLFHVNFANTNEQIIDDFIDCFESCFGRRLNKCYPSESYRATNSPCIKVHCGDRIIVKLFKEYAGGLMRGSSDLKIPDFIMNGTEDIKYSFLSAAIDSDGCLHSNNIQISSCCKYYCEQLCLILSGLGYHATIVQCDKKGSKYHFSKSNRTGVRRYDSYAVKVGRDDEKAMLYEKMSTIKRYDGYAYRGISHGFVENKIISISESFDLDVSVYDMETASHWYILNNFVSHNCLSVPFDDLLANGFNTKQTDVRPAQSINTAFQLVAVIFQVQSLQQFGKNPCRSKTL